MSHNDSKTAEAAVPPSVDLGRANSAPTQEDKYGIKAHWKCLAACTLVSMCPFQYGTDFGLIGGMQAMVGFLEVFGHPANTPTGWNIATDRQQLISSLMTLGAFISSGLAGPIATYTSRKQSIWAACILCIVSNVIMMTTTSIGGLYAGRFLIGLANGMFMTFSQLYIQVGHSAHFLKIASLMPSLF